MARFFLLSLFLAGCSGLDVQATRDPAANFNAYRTYAWSGIELPPDEDPELTTRLRAAVDAELGDRGLTSASSDRAHLLVHAHLTVETVTSETLNQRYRDPRVRGPGTGGLGPEWYAFEYERGTLVIDLVDRVRAKPVWRGSARAEIDRSANPQQRRGRATAVVHQIFERYPSQP